METITQKRYNVAVLCSSIGGAVIGYEMADFHVQLAVDKNDKELNVIKENYENVNILHKTIRETGIQDFENHSLAHIDVLDVSIPTSWVIRSKETSSNREPIFTELIKIMYQVKPSIIVCHIDAKFAKGKHRLSINELLELMKQVGYDVRMDILKSSLYGIPNEKQWAFIIGVRKEIGIKPVFPDAQSTVVMTKQAIGDLINEPVDTRLNANRLEYMKNYFPPGVSHKEAKRVIEENELPINAVYYQRDRWDKPFFALPSTNIRPFHPINNRLLSLNELKRLQTFPDDYSIKNLNSKLAWKKVCTSVPPLLIQKVAWTMKKEILDHM